MAGGWVGGGDPFPLWAYEGRRRSKPEETLGGPTNNLTLAHNKSTMCRTCIYHANTQDWGWWWWGRGRRAHQGS
jgi:hypothetical protein